MASPETGSIPGSDGVARLVGRTVATLQQLDGLANPADYPRDFEVAKEAAAMTIWALVTSGYIDPKGLPGPDEVAIAASLRAQLADQGE